MYSRHFFAFVLLLFPATIFSQKIAKENAPNSINPEPDIYQKVHITLPNNTYTNDIVAVLLAKYDILSSNPDLGLALQYMIESAGNKHFQFVQTYKNYPIYNAGIKVNFRGNTIVSVLNYLHPLFQSINLNFTKSESQVLKSISVQANSYHTTIEKKIFFDNNIAIPVYELITFSHQMPVSFEWIVNAQTGEVLQQLDRAAYLSHPPIKNGQSATQNCSLSSLCYPTTNQQNCQNTRGYIFNPDPCTKSHTTYNAPFSDNNDQTTSAFNSVMDDVQLLDLDYDTDFELYKLSGPYVTIEDIELPAISPAISFTGNFYFNRSQSGFEDVMAYYHIDKYQRYIQSLGITNLCNFPLTVDAHGNNGLDNSHFVPPNNANNFSRIAYGTGGVDDAEDADVIVHEYGHALSYSASPNSNIGTQRTGLDEGIGDYIAASYSYDLDTFQWSRLFNWDGNNEYWVGRKATSADSYSSSLSSTYEIGTIWTATLMDIRQALGAEVGDKLFFEELYHNAPNMTLQDASRCYLDADSALYGGIHTKKILEFFCARSLFSGQNCTNSISKPSAILAWQMYPNPASTYITLDIPDVLKKPILVGYDVLGKEVFRSAVEKESKVDITLSKGLYFMQIEADNYRSNIEKLIVQ